MQNHLHRPRNGSEEITQDSPLQIEPSITVIQPHISTHKNNDLTESNNSVNNNNVIGEHNRGKTNDDFEMRDLNGPKQSPTDENSKLI